MSRSHAEFAVDMEKEVGKQARKSRKSQNDTITKLRLQLKEAEDVAASWQAHAEGIYAQHIQALDKARSLEKELQQFRGAPERASTDQEGAKASLQSQLQEERENHAAMREEAELGRKRSTRATSNILHLGAHSGP